MKKIPVFMLTAVLIALLSGCFFPPKAVYVIKPPVIPLGNYSTALVKVTKSKYDAFNPGDANRKVIRDSLLSRMSMEPSLPSTMNLNRNITNPQLYINIYITEIAVHTYTTTYYGIPLNTKCRVALNMLVELIDPKRFGTAAEFTVEVISDLVNGSISNIDQTNAADIAAEEIVAYLLDNVAWKPPNN